MPIDKRKIGLELLKNSPGNMKTFLEDYLKKTESGEKLNGDLSDFDTCVEYIKKCCFDITGWMLWEMPSCYSICFYNECTNKSFDLAVWNGEITPRYIASGNEEDASTIEEAIAKNETTEWC